ncbi:MAG: ceramidase domain-containing protein [Cypionkella sp.]
MDWVAAVDIYCERTSPAFWAEPLNAASNLAFPLAALWAGVEARRRRITDTLTWLLIAMAALIGLGSFLFHTFANVWSSFADTLPIWSFVAVFVGVAMQRIGGIKPGRVLIIGLGVAAIVTILTLAASDGSAGGETAPDRLNGSGQYAPAVVALLVFSFLTQLRRHPARRWIAAATATFLLSLIFRTFDLAACASFPQGLHFLWHLLNGAMIALLLQMLIRHGQAGLKPTS